MTRIELPAGDGPEVLRALELVPRWGEAVGALEKAAARSGLDWRLHELVRMRIALLNRCTVCMGWRNDVAFDAGVTEDLLLNVEHWADHPGFTDGERAALEYAERYCTDSAGIDDALLARLGEHFGAATIVDLTLVIGKYVSMGRFMQVLGLDQACALTYDEAGTLQVTS